MFTALLDSVQHTAVDSTRATATYDELLRDVQESERRLRDKGITLDKPRTTDAPRTKMGKILCRSPEDAARVSKAYAAAQRAGINSPEDRALMALLRTPGLVVDWNYEGDA